jgi:1-aminocyclopropane-1-carboxylate deaminase/D-cysteine desulfhydrase-like pyridoxal-dependent ACC family enzyme
LCHILAFFTLKFAANIVEFKGFDIDKDLLSKPWLQSVQWPTAISKNIHFDMLRLDLIHPLVSGNKWLKLQGWIEKAEQGTWNGIITSGGPWSNFLHACGYACFINKIPLQILVKGNQDLETAMLKDLKTWGTQITFLNRQSFYDKKVAAEIAEKQEYLHIPMGGDGPEGESGVRKWMDALPLEYYDIICCAAGTGTTAAGIAKSKLEFNELWIFDPGTKDASLKKRFDQNINHRHAKKTILHQLPGKFGKLTPELASFMQHWYEMTGIALDFVYTAPMCHTLVEMIAAGNIHPGTRMLIIHTGGIQGNRSHPELPVG